MQLTEERLPSHWASALVNDDWTGYDAAEIEDIQMFLINELDGLRCLDVSDDSSYQLAPSYYPWLLAGNYSTFTFTDK